MDRLQTFQELLSSQSVQIPILGFVLNLLIAAGLAYILGWIYVTYGHSLSNRKLFARNFILMTMITTLIITVVKSSLALSLGLVGALSIVRFRTAIKDPEELAFMFFSISIGLGLGADQRVTTLIAFATISAFIVLRKRESMREDYQNLHLTVNFRAPDKIEINQIVDILTKNCRAVNLKRFDETKEAMEASFLVEFENVDQLSNTRNALRLLSDDMKISFMDNKGVL